MLPSFKKTRHKMTLSLSGLNSNINTCNKMFVFSPKWSLSQILSVYENCNTLVFSLKRRNSALTSSVALLELLCYQNVENRMEIPILLVVD